MIQYLTQKASLMTTRHRLLHPRLLLAGTILIALGGCGGSGALPTYRAAGKVVFADGKPLAGGRVEFSPVQNALGPPARAQIQPDGSFRLGTYRPDDGAVEGEHRVSVMPPLPDNLEGMKIIPMPIDPRFTRFETSGLKFTVTRDPTKNQFVLQVRPPKK
jgi:hypothetical protein